MACLIDQVVVFNETGKGNVTCPSSFPEEPSDFSVSIDGQNLNYVGIFEAMGHEMWASGGTADNPIFPAVMFYNDLDGCWFVAAESESTPIVGEHRISMCSSESDDDSCPDVPLADSIPEKYADYIDANGNFVPKASSGGGGGDCAFTTATLRIVDENGEQPKMAENTLPENVFLPVIVDGVFGTMNPNYFSDFTIVLYNGSLVVPNLYLNNLVSYSGNIRMDEQFNYAVITGDAIISVNKIITG